MPGKDKPKTGQNENKKNKVTIVVIIILAIVVIALVGVVAYLLGKGKNDTGNATRDVADSVRTVVDENSSQDIMNQMREEVEEGMFECKMSMSWSFANGTSESKDAYVTNSTNNTHPICFDIYLNDTEELIYSSPVLPVGADLKNIKLDKPLSKGEYKATVMYSLLKDTESQEEISSAGFVITINVLN